MASPRSLPTKIKARSAAKNVASIEADASVAALALDALKIAIV
jgi:hypothetical protein